MKARLIKSLISESPCQFSLKLRRPSRAASFPLFSRPTCISLNKASSLLIHWPFCFSEQRSFQTEKISTIFRSTCAMLGQRTANAFRLGSPWFWEAWQVNQQKRCHTLVSWVLNNCLVRSMKKQTQGYLRILHTQLQSKAAEELLFQQQIPTSWWYQFIMVPG